MSRFHRRFRPQARSAGAEAPALPRNTVIHGDCLAVMPTLPSGSVDFILTDPPYLVRYRDRSGRTVANDRDGSWLAPAFAEAYRLLKDDSLCVSFYGWQAVDAFMAAWRTAGFRPVGHLVFAKRYASSSRFTAARHEAAYLLAKGRPALPASPPDDVVPFPYTGNRLHPTQKPVPALSSLIAAYTRPGDLVFDPFAGSGSTLVAAQTLGRRALGIELDARHAQTGVNRLKQRR